jgi:valyl-tRNA synthetase
MQLADFPQDKIPLPWQREGLGEGFNPLYPTDQRILSRLNQTISSMTKDLDNYEYGLAKIKFEEFFWKDFCDNYLELVKLRTYKPELFKNGQAKKQSAQYTLSAVFENILKLIAPYLPFITEEIYQDYFKKDWEISIHTTHYPESHTERDTDHEKNMEIILSIVDQVRKYKSEHQISMGAELEQLIITCSLEQQKNINQYLDDLIGVTKANKISFKEGEFSLVISEKNAI